MESHKGACQKNLEGSSNAMEVETAGAIFSRSVEQCKIQYVTVLSDGYSKAFNHVAEGMLSITWQSECTQGWGS